MKSSPTKGLGRLSRSVSLTDFFDDLNRPVDIGRLNPQVRHRPEAAGSEEGKAEAVLETGVLELLRGDFFRVPVKEDHVG